MQNKNYTFVRDHNIRLSDVLNDCTSLCVPTYKDEPLSSILNKICNKINDCCGSGGGSSVFIEEGDNITITGTGTEANPWVINADASGFNLFTDNSPSLVLNGNGTVGSPLSGDVQISGRNGNIIQLVGDGLFATGIQQGVIYGGIVTWLQDYDFHVSAAGYYINGLFYESPEAYFTLSAPDLTDNRIDTFIVDNTGAASVLEGTPSGTPSQAPLDPATQLQLSLTLVEVGTTEPTITTECAFVDNAEWVATPSNILRFNPDSTTDPCDGAKAIEATSLTTGNNILLDRGASFQPAGVYTVLTFLLKSKGPWGAGRSISLQWELSGVPLGTPVTIFDGSVGINYGFDSTDTGLCQIVSIPIIDFGINSNTVADSLRITATATTPSLIGFHIDNICLQDIPIPPPPDSDELLKITGNDTTPGYLFDKLVEGTNVAFTINNPGGNETLTIESLITAQNGLTPDSPAPGIIELGGILLHDTYINQDSYIFQAYGTGAGDPNSPIFSVLNTGLVDTNPAFYANTGGTGYAILGDAPAGFGVLGTGFIGVQGQGGIGVIGIGESSGGNAGTFILRDASFTNNTVETVLSLSKESPSLPSNNIGISIDFTNSTNSGGNTGSALSNRVISKLTDIIQATATSQYEVWGLNSGSSQQQFTVKGTGQIQFNQYDGNNFTGSETALLGVDINGNVIEVSAAGLAAVTADNGLRISSGSNVQLGSNTYPGRALLHNTYIDGVTSGLYLTSEIPAVEGFTNPAVLNVENTYTGYNIGLHVDTSASTTGTGILLSGSDGGGVGISINDYNGAGIRIDNSGPGIEITTDDPNSSAIVVNKSGYFGSIFSAGIMTATGIFTDNDEIAEMVNFTRGTSGTPANGIGASIGFSLQTLDGGTVRANHIASRLTNVTHATRFSELVILGSDSGSPTEIFAFKGDGMAQGYNYGAGAMTAGAATFGLAVDADGNFIEVALGGAGFVNPMGAIGDIITSSDGAGTPVAINVGAAGTVLTSNGVGFQPTWQALAGSGTVTSVAQSFTGGLISVGGSPITGAGTLALTVAGTSGGIPYFTSSSSWASSSILALNALMIGGGIGGAPSTVTTGSGVLTALGIQAGLAGGMVLVNGVGGTPSSITLTNGTGLPITAGTTGTLGVTRGGTGLTSLTAGQILYASALNTLSALAVGTNGQVLSLVGGLPAWTTLAGAGTVTSVNMSGGTTGFNVTGGPITSSGTLVLAGILNAVNGGTGQSVYAIGDLLQANSTTTLSKLAAVATGNVLISGGVGVVSSWGKVGLTTHVSGRLPYANIVQVNARSVMGNPTNAVADLQNIGSSAANQVLRSDPSGLTIGFGALNLASANTVGTSILAFANGGTGAAGAANGTFLIGSGGTTWARALPGASNGLQWTFGAGTASIGNIVNPALSTSTDATTITWTLANGKATKVIIANTGRTLAIAGTPVAGETYILEVIQDVVGNRTITTWPATILWDGGVTPTLSTGANKRDLFTFFWDGNNYLGKLVGRFN